MSILLGFNNSLTLSIKELQENTQLPEKELLRQVQSLIESKLVVLAEKPEDGNSEPKQVTIEYFSSLFKSGKLNIEIFQVN